MHAAHHQEAHHHEAGPTQEAHLDASLQEARPDAVPPQEACAEAGPSQEDHKASLPHEPRLSHRELFLKFKELNFPRNDFQPIISFIMQKLGLQGIDLDDTKAALLHSFLVNFARVCSKKWQQPERSLARVEAKFSS
jgi:hypothetical protein